MSTKVVTAPAGHAKRPVRSEKSAKQAEQQPAVNEDAARLAKDDSEQDVSVAPAKAEQAKSAESQTSMAGEFTFGSALAEAAAASGSLITDAQRADEVGFGAFGGSDGSTPLLLAAIGLAAVGLIFIVKDGGNGNDAVVPVNKAPTITAPAAVTAAEDAANVALGKPTTADADVGDTVTVTATATNGTVTKAADGSFTFTPTANFNGTATITYSATDGKVAAPVTATQTVTVTAVNDAPTITAGTVAAIDEDSAAGATFTVTTADVDAGSTVTTSAVVPAAQGTVAKNADGSFTFKPAANYNGTATVVVSASDGTATTTKDVAIIVNPVNDPATIAPLTVSAVEDTPKNLSDVLTVTDIDGDVNAATFTFTQPAHGAIAADATGDLIYTPTANYFGPDQFAITVKDSGGASATYTIAINVADVPEGPVLTPFSLDIGTNNVAVNKDAGTANFTFTDDSSATSNVNLTNFTDNDKITVTNAVSSDYNFGRSFEDINDLVITYTDADTGASNKIVIQDILPDAGAANSFASATTLIGFTFMTFA